MHIIAAKAVAFGEALTPAFKEYQTQIVKNAARLAAELEKRGAKLVAGGTDNHLMLVDVTCFGITGKEAQLMLDDVNITCNKNGIPFDKQKPFVTSGIRLGTPAVTSRGMKEDDMEVIADCIVTALTDKDGSKKEEVKAKVENLLKKYPLYT